MIGTYDNTGYCTECGHQRDWMTLRCTSVSCPTNAVDWSQGVTEPGPIRAPTRAELMIDSRRAGWRICDELPMPRTRVVIIARQTQTGAWLIERHGPDGPPPYIYGMAATHWHEDTIGTP